MIWVGFEYFQDLIHIFIVNKQIIDMITLLLTLVLVIFFLPTILKYTFIFMFELAKGIVGCLAVFVIVGFCLLVLLAAIF